MVKIAVAGGSGQVAREVIDRILATKKHDITILSRHETPMKDIQPGLGWRVADYGDHLHLVDALRGTHTLLSFVQLIADPEGKTQKSLIDAAIAAGVKRFAPSEYGSAGTGNMPWWTGKESTREYLKKVNANKKILEYTLFQPGLFLDYLACPHKTAKYIDPLQSVFDFEKCRALMVEGHEDTVITLTTAADLAAIVTRAIDYEGEWPEVSGIMGNRVTYSGIIEIGENIRGRQFSIEKVKIEDLEAGILNASWALEKKHQAVPDDQYGSFVKAATIGFLLGSIKGAWSVSDELNRLYPDYIFDKAEAFLDKVWTGKP